jgi:hypothetical protein
MSRNGNKALTQASKDAAAATRKRARRGASGHDDIPVIPTAADKVAAVLAAATGDARKPAAARRRLAQTIIVTRTISRSGVVGQSAELIFLSRETALLRVASGVRSRLTF